MSECLWVCHRCEMIGDQADAERHVELKGHRVEQLDQDTSDAVREQMSAERAAALLVHSTSLSSPRKDHS